MTGFERIFALMLRLFEPVHDYNPKWSSFRIPEHYLTSEQAEEQRSFFRNMHHSKETKFNFSLETILWTVVNKLVERTIPYQILAQAIRNGDEKKVFDIISHNITSDSMGSCEEEDKENEKKEEQDVERSGVNSSGTSDERETTDRTWFNWNALTSIPRSACDYFTRGGRNEENEENVVQAQGTTSSVVENFEAEVEILLNELDHRRPSEKISERLKPEEEEHADIEQYQKELRMMSENEQQEVEEIHRKVLEELEIERKRLEENLEKMVQAAKEREEVEREMEEGRRIQMESEFRSRLEDQKKKHKEAMRKLREEREEMERETERIQMENLRDFQARTNAFWSCVQLKMRWEDQEQQWADWLRLLKTSVARAKIQWMKFEDVARNNDEEEIRIELSLLFQKTLAAHDLLYKAFFYLKLLSDQAPDKLFLRILMKNVQESSNTLFIVLQNMDKIEINVPNDAVMRGIQELLNSCEITSTWKLRDIAGKADPKDYEKFSEPLKDENSGQETSSKLYIQEIREE